MSFSSKLEAGKLLQDLDTSAISTEYSDVSLSSCRHSLLCGDMSFPATPAESQLGTESGIDQATPCGDARLPQLQEQEEDSSKSGPTPAPARVDAAFDGRQSMDSNPTSPTARTDAVQIGASRIRRSSVTRPPSVKERVNQVENDIQKVGQERKRRSSRGALAGCGSDGNARSGMRPSRSASDLRSTPGVLGRWNLQSAVNKGQALDPCKAACSPRPLSPAGLQQRGHAAEDTRQTKIEEQEPRLQELSATCSALARQLAKSQVEHESSVESLRRSHAAEMRRLELTHTGLVFQRDSELRMARKELNRVRSDARLQIAKARATCQRELADALGAATSLCNAISSARQQLPQ